MLQIKVKGQMYIYILQAHNLRVLLYCFDCTYKLIKNVFNIDTSKLKKQKITRLYTLMCI